ncbi:glycosylation-dependent cell adhesion molecule 1 [Moschus berezovskii]|uniref:glycosylation-dependent cell adhesion molecule 1 n=1 Tax=Moschus berezovskii TaxID=68408 RepID=UPI002444430F|nr:glycosylation-dependent cell adhesion molecule 1 [Moschus berezovskii]
MKFLCVLLLASLATTSLAILNEPEDETHLEAQPTDASAQFIISNLQISNEDLSKEPSISREELISKEQIVIRSSKRPQNQNPKLPLSILKEKHLRNAALGSEETTEHTPCAASTTEGKLMELGHKIISNLENTVKETIKYLKSLFSHASEVMKP